MDPKCRLRLLVGLIVVGLALLLFGWLGAQRAYAQAPDLQINKSVVPIGVVNSGAALSAVGQG